MGTVSTSTANVISTADKKTRYDTACKELLSDKYILANIVQGCLPEYEKCSIQEIAEKYIEGKPRIGFDAVEPEVPIKEPETTSQVKERNKEDAKQTEGTVRYDILFDAITPDADSLSLIINIEAQNKYEEKRPLTKRGIYYASRLISAQNGRDFPYTQYEKVRKVYSIWICTNPPVRMHNSITRYQITEDCLVGNATRQKTDYDLVTIVMIYLGRNEVQTPLLRLLNGLLSEEKNSDEKKQLCQEFHIPMACNMEGMIKEMCNLSEGIHERGREEGLKEGFAKGRQEGREEGMLNAILGIMNKQNCSFDKACDFMGLPQDGRDTYRAMLQH